MKRMGISIDSRVWVFSFILLCFLLSGFVVTAQEEDPLVSNPEYVSWSRYGNGTWTELKTTRVVQGEKLEGYMVVTLVSKDQYKVVVSVRRDAISNGERMKGTTFTRDIMAKLPKSAVDFVFNPASATDRGQSYQVINKRRYLCPWIQSQPGNSLTRVLWFNNDVPGLITRVFEKDTENNIRTDMQLVRFGG